jgi:hypothetical protein
MGKWNSSEIEELKRFYQENNVPSDRLVKDKDALDRFAAEFNNRVRHTPNLTPKEIADQLFKLRKSGKLPRIRK